jgi:hypothetical protein
MSRDPASRPKALELCSIRADWEREAANLLLDETNRTYEGEVFSDEPKDFEERRFLKRSAEQLELGTNQGTTPKRARTSLALLF